MNPSLQDTVITLLVRPYYCDFTHSMRQTQKYHASNNIKWLYTAIHRSNFITKITQPTEYDNCDKKIMANYRVKIHLTKSQLL